MSYYLQIKSEKILSCSELPVQDVNIKNLEISKEIFEDYSLDNSKYFIKNGELTKKTDEEIKQEILAKDFFLTSLGYVRRQVTMKDGTTRNFLTDILPRLKAGVPILTYTKDLQQNAVKVTEEFINECDEQLLKDFYGG